MGTRELRYGGERGMSLVELMIALIVLAVGLLAVGRMFPTGARSQEQDRLLTSANYFAQEKLETLTGRTWSDPLLTDGRHPAGTATESLEQGQWTRFYLVTTLTGKLDNLKKVDVTVNYQGAGRASRFVTATTYVRR
jgi:prepilin-type N-terminal cleavage/methylation domain-containing protein